MASETRPFLKMNGLGNDFVVWDARETPLRLERDVIARLGDRESGIGFDQMITVERSPLGVDAFMRIHNQDGGEVAACGNATRCIGRILMEEAGKDVEWVSYAHGMHGYIFPEREGDGAYAVDDMQRDAIGTVISYLDRQLKS